MYKRCASQFIKGKTTNGFNGEYSQRKLSGRRSSALRRMSGLRRIGSEMCKHHLEYGFQNGNDKSLFVSCASGQFVSVNDETNVKISISKDEVQSASF